MLFPVLLWAGIVAGVHGQQAAAPVHVAEATLDSYVGQYRDALEPDAPISVFRDHDHLYTEGPRLRHGDLTAQSATVFLSKSGQTQFTFVTGANGAVTGMEVGFGGSTSTYEKFSSTPQPNHFRAYSGEEAMIPMRDGVKLHAVILRPEHTDENLPFLMERTPYGVAGLTSDAINAAFPGMAQSGYIFVMEDIRGRFKSEGTFVMMRPLADHHDPKAVDESTDTYDTVAWLLTHVPHNNGRVGVMGISYPGFLAAEAGIDPHPAVRAISPQAPMTDVWLGDDFFHNGAFRETYGYDYVMGVESNKEITPSNIHEDEYTFFLHAGSYAAAGKGSVDDLPTGQAFLAHPAYDEFWSSRAVQPHETKVTVPTLEVGGWWDQEDLWGPQAEYAALEKHNQPSDPAHRVYMVLGPWRHGSWAATERHLGPLNFGEPVGDEFRQRIEAPFFAYYLKDEPGFKLENTATYQTGSDRWEFYSEWPPKNVTERDLYLGADGTASFVKPADGHAYKAYRSDPANPVPYRERPVQATYSDGSHWYTWLVQDQRLADGRPDVATFETAPLGHDVTVTGNVIADLIASTSGTDSDWVVKLVDVFPADADKGPEPSADCGATCLRIDPAAQTWSKVNPNGYELMIADEIFRGRYWKSYSEPAAIPANKAEEFKFSLHAADHVFLKGHRIMVQVQSSWFPLYDRNPQTFVPNIMTAQPSDYRPAEQRIYAGSHVELPEPQGEPERAQFTQIRSCLRAGGACCRSRGY
ncbi:MAG: CocE/NonD family hydrolase [Acidobacteriaceae bacterium]